jgi:hypothetical protein
MGHRGATPGHQQVVDALGNKHPIRQLVEAARLRDRRKPEDHVAGDMGFHRPAVDADRILKTGAAEHVLAREHMAADHAPGFADAELRRQIDDVGLFESRHRAQEIERVERLAAAVDFAAREIVGLEAVDGGAVLARQLRKIHPPLNLRTLRPHDRGLAREMMGTGGFGLLHQRRNRPPGIAGFFRIDAVQTKHHRGVQHAADIVADLMARAGPGREVAVAGAVDENTGAHRLTAGLGLQHQRVDAARVMHHHAGAERVEENIHAMAQEQIVGGDLVGRGVIGLRQNLSENQMRRVEPAEPIDAIEQIRRNAPHHPMHLAKNIGVQPAEIRDTRRGAHAAEEPITLDQQRAAARARRSHRRSDAGGPAAEDNDFIFAIQRHLPRGLFDGFAEQVCGFLIVGGDHALAGIVAYREGPCRNKRNIGPMESGGKIILSRAWTN